MESRFFMLLRSGIFIICPPLNFRKADLETPARQTPDKSQLPIHTPFGRIRDNIPYFRGFAVFSRDRQAALS